MEMVHLNRVGFSKVGEECWRRDGKLTVRLCTGALTVPAGDLVVVHLVVRDQFPADVVGASATGTWR